MSLKWRIPKNQFILALLFSSLVSEGLFWYSAVYHHSLEFDYLSGNLALAWIPFILTLRLSKVLRSKIWSSWEALGLSAIWLIFIPNSFYMISDFIHLQDISQLNNVYVALMLTSFIYTGVALGFSSLYLIHIHLKQRLSNTQAGSLITFILFICSVAIYFGRDLRWNSWDVFTNSGGLLFEIGDRIRHLASYPDMLTSILAFFILLLAMYNLLWHGARLILARGSAKNLL